MDGQKIDLNNITKKYHVDTVGLHFPKKGMEVSTYIKDGMIEDWDMLEQILDYSYAKIIKSESEYHPVLFSEAAVGISQIILHAGIEEICLLVPKYRYFSYS